MKATFTDIAEICESQPEVELGTAWGGRPTYKVPRGAKGKGFLVYRAPGKTPSTRQPVNRTPICLSSPWPMRTPS